MNRYTFSSPVSWIEISKSALHHNAAIFKQIIGNTLLGCVIKSNAYGHGMISVAHILQESEDVDWLLVAALSEAIALRLAGIIKPILVTSTIDADPIEAARLDIDIIATDITIIHKLQSILHGTTYRLNIHVKVDTGLSRYGIPYQLVIDQLKMIKTCNNIYVRGIFSHCAQAEREDQQFTHNQIDRFRTIVEHPDIASIPIKHIANSSATIMHRNNLGNLARIGIGIYGIWPSDYIEISAQEKYGPIFLKQALTWKTYITHIKEIAAGSSVGYGSEFIAQRTSRIATVPVGYYDGYDLRLSHKGVVRIKETFVSIVGRICMNVMMIDVTDISVTVGDEVELIGLSGSNTILALTKQAQITNRRELIVRIPTHIPRIIAP